MKPSDSGEQRGPVRGDLRDPGAPQGNRRSIIGGDAMSSPALMGVAGAAAEGTTMASYFNPDEPRPEVVRFNAAFTAKFGVPPDAGSALGYDCVQLLAGAMKEAGSAVPEDVARALHALKDWRGVTGAQKTQRACRSSAASFVARLHPPNDEETAMKFMMIVKATKETEAGRMPTNEELVAMDKYNEELQKAGILLELSGLAPSGKGARIRFEGKKRMVIDGPFAEAKELIAGFWLIQVKSREDAIEWAKRIPFGTEVQAHDTPEIELRQLIGPEDFAPGEGVDRAKALGEKLGKS
jgi:hypothetical protein